MRLTRRSTVAGSLGLVGCGPALASGPFPLGVTAADPTATGIMLATQYRGTGAAAVRLLGPSGEMLRELRVADGGFGRVDFDGLQPATRYQYEVLHDGGPEVVTGRFRTTALHGGRPVVRLGAVSCLFQTRPYDVLARAAQEDLDAFLLLGDTVYADGAQSLGDFRKKWAEGFGRQESQALRAAHPVIATWDDHEFINDYSPTRVSKQLEASAKAAFDEHLPTRRTAQQRLWRRFSFGDTVDVFCLDCRSERQPLRGEYLSPEQLTWFIEGVQNSPATFKVIMNSVPIGDFPGAFFGLFDPDRWQGYPQQRDSVLKALESVPGVLWVSGDFHIGTVGRVALSGPGANLIEVLVGPGSSSPNPTPSYPRGPQWDFVTGRNTYTTLSFQPDSGEVAVAFIDGAGRTLHAQTLRLR
jgi:alkaline phosphatase D